MRARVWLGITLVMAVAAAIAAPVPAAVAGSIRGLPSCSADGLQGWIWLEGDVVVAFTEPSTPTFDGAQTSAAADDCVVSAECAAVAGVGWKEWTAVVGTIDDEVLTGTAGRDVVVALGGDDIIDARGGQDVVCAGGGDDDVRGGPKGDILLGGHGNDLLRGGSGSDTLRGNGGDDILLGGGWHDTLRGGPGNDALYGSSGGDDLAGGAGIDACFGGAEADTIATCPIRSQAGVRYGAQPLLDFTVRIEAGLALDQDRVEAEIDRILGDERSWVGDGDIGFRRVNSGWDFQIYIATPATVDEICAPLDTGGYLSCRNGSTVALNVDRWRTATSFWPTGIDVYRQYLVNHEVGHVLGQGHVACPGPGELAPVMMQQTKGLDGCLPNGWVYP